MRNAGLGLVAVLIATSSLAAPAPVWTVEKPASSVGFATSLGGDRVAGVFKIWDAAIRFDPANLAGSSVTAVVATGSAATGNADQEQALPTVTFFNAGKFPTATFSAHGFKALGAGRYSAQGTLTLRGVTRPLTLPFTLAVAGTEARMTGQVPLSRLAFGVGEGEWKATNTLPDAVMVTVSIRARRAP